MLLAFSEHTGLSLAIGRDCVKPPRRGVYPRSSADAGQILAQGDAHAFMRFSLLAGTTAASADLPSPSRRPAYRGPAVALLVLTKRFRLVGPYVPLCRTDALLPLRSLTENPNDLLCLGAGLSVALLVSLSLERLRHTTA